MKKKKMYRYEIDRDSGKDVSDKDFEVMMGQFVYALENHQCPNCQARVRFDYTGELVKITCPAGDYYSEMGAGMVLGLGRFLASSREITLLDAVTKILEEMKLQQEGLHAGR
jgi:hypothetical protein